MSRKPAPAYKPEPAFNSSSRVDAAMLPNGDEAVLYTANGRSGACWGVRVFRDPSGHFTVVSQSEQPWTAKGEAKARAEFAKLSAVGQVERSAAVAVSQ